MRTVHDRNAQLATDFYEYGWGDSFHFAHTKRGESHVNSIRRHEVRIVEALGLTAKQTVLDAGCGVGGPARTIARKSMAKVTGVTLNAYQVRGTAIIVWLVCVHHGPTQDTSPLGGQVNVLW